MGLSVQYLWLAPAAPLLAAGVIAISTRRQRRLAATLAIGAMGVSLICSLAAFLTTLTKASGAESYREVFNFHWLQIGATWLDLGWVLDPLTAVMLVMVTFIGLLIFIYSAGYMAHDENFTRFFGFLSLFAAAMLGLIIANSLLLFFICWELVGLASYLLIGFWYQKPSAAAAAKKAFITTRIGDMGFLLGLVWLYASAGTLVFYDHGKGCIEPGVVAQLTHQSSWMGLSACAGIGLLIFCGAIGKSGQLPLHVWLPDAMEGPTPVSALIHAATMVAAGVFLVARMYPLMEENTGAIEGVSPALMVITWIGALTAVFAACTAVAQTDIKRILAYSTVSQLGYMMIGLGTGGVGVGMFHLITHAFFKALLFLGAGSVIHGCHEQQDIRRLGGVRKYMPLTFATYAAGMMALCGVPLFFSGFWSKDDILHSAAIWEPSSGPFYLGLFGALLTAFHMTRQVCLVFFGAYRGGAQDDHGHAATNGHAGANEPHESPGVMTGPLVILAFFAVVLGFFGTPAWPWFQHYLEGRKAEFEFGNLVNAETLTLLLRSSIIVLAGIAAGWWFYGRKPFTADHEPDPLARLQPDLFTLLERKFFVDEFYETTVIRFNAWLARACEWCDRWVVGAAVELVGYVALGASWASRLFDEYGVNLGFDSGCDQLKRGGRIFSRWQSGQAQNYLRVIGVALAALLLLLAVGGKGS